MNVARSSVSFLCVLCVLCGSSPMNVLVTAGNTLVPIDKVRCITNVFTGRTGTRIALQGYQRGHQITFLTSHPEVVAAFDQELALEPERWRLFSYRTFADLEQLMSSQIRQGKPDAVIHCAAVSDYQSAGVFAPAPKTRFRADGHWESTSPELPKLIDRSAAKVKSDEPELWLRLVRAPKLIDRIREPWGYRGILVKFKLEVGIEAQELLDIAEGSRRHSRAELIVANTLEEAASWAYLGPLADGYHRINRELLAVRLFEEIERLHREREHG
jgi:phosphopantothenate---cysteine ligase (CTP)